jgi:hypothetical protein
MSWRIVAQRVADGMVLSTANLYFTAHDNAGAGVFRTAQSAKPGQEIELCHEPDCRFGDIVWAKVDGHRHRQALLILTRCVRSHSGGMLEWVAAYALDRVR